MTKKHIYRIDTPGKETAQAVKVGSILSPTPREQETSAFKLGYAKGKRKAENQKKYGK